MLLRPINFFIIIFCIIMSINGVCYSKKHHQVFFKGTNHELHVYKIFGKKPGKTMMLIGGIQGDEAGGFLSCDLYADISLEKGNLIVVPRANFYSILLKKRGVNVDMNRKFQSNGDSVYEEKIVKILKELIGKSDVLLNNHDGSGFYSERWENNMRNPLRFGQSIIADCDIYINPRTGKKLFLGDMARRVSQKINKDIENTNYHFHFNNHRTSSKDSKHKEQRKSATYYSIYNRGIPAFGIETSKSLPLELKVRHHNLAINAFMDLFDIIPETPPIYLEPPSLKYLVVSINNELPVVIERGKSLIIQKNDSISITHVETNYKRGVIADIIGYGTVNDIGKTIYIKYPTTIRIRKDHFNCGNINIAFDKENKKSGYSQPNISSYSKDIKKCMLFYKVKINGKEVFFPNYSRAHLVRGDTFEIVDIISDISNGSKLKVNFKGFVSNPKDNTGEDRGYIIRTDRDLLKKYSLNRDGKIYPVITLNENKIIGKLFVEIEEAFLSYVVLKVNNKDKICLNPNETFKNHNNNEIELVDLKTNIPDNEGVKVYLKLSNYSRFLIRQGESINLDLINNNTTSDMNLYRLDIIRDTALLGSVFVQKNFYSKSSLNESFKDDIAVK